MRKFWWGGCLLSFFWAGLVASFARESGPPLLVVTPIVASEGGARVWIVILNAGETPLDYRFPEEFSGTLFAPGVTREVVLHRRTPDPAEVRIVPGTFTRQEYAVPIPKNFGASVELALDGNPAQRVTLSVPVPSAAEGAPASSGVNAAGSRPAGLKPMKAESTAMEFFREHFFPYESMYLVMGWEDPNVKFQISFKYRLLNGDLENPGWLVRQAPMLTNLYLAYTQTSLWDTSAPSSPFYDTTYKPEFFYQWQRVDRGRWADWFALDAQGGLQHASNGQGGEDSRSFNTVYLMPTFYFGDTDRFHFRFAPRVYAYFGDLSDNPDIADYYGHVQLRAMAGWADGLELSVIGTIGDGFDHGSAQFDLTYPLYRLGGRNLAVYLDLQYFTGYGESLLYYYERTSTFRAGFSLWR